MGRIADTKFYVQHNMLEGKGSLFMTCYCIHRRNKKDLKKVATKLKILFLNSSIFHHHWIVLHTFRLAATHFICTVPFPPAVSCPVHIPFICSTLSLVFLFISPPFLAPPCSCHLISFCPHVLHSLLLFILQPPSSCSLPGPWQW